ncbi:GNAT family N-acetyltransferase [Agromyces seonyuensis]|uniref:GNAT family N-acetyltransferase n=1 Tax=Agromyces seonyuensis TaxID=2662446 RepID=A0A6I4P3B2_9MICO|nr:GNAT family N-acetyltransferase [Agromyces seonyuensis]MWB97807.1 GNAT family N-acetyltransferase [Agromyces seonyuensis]
MTAIPPLPEELETERLVLRTPSSEDAAVYRRLWTERDPRVPPHRRIDADGRPTEDDIAAELADPAWSGRSGLRTVVRKKDGAVLGYCGIVADAERAHEAPEIAFELLRAVHGRGYATEAARAVLDRAQDASLATLRASVWDWNTASRRVLAKLGFVETGEVDRVSTHGRSLVTLRDLAHGRRDGGAPIQ